MSNDTRYSNDKPELPGDNLTELLRTGAQQLLSQAVEAELEELLTLYKDRRLEDGRQAVVRNGYLPERTVQAGIGDVTVQVPKVRDHSGAGIKFHSGLLPPYLKRSQSIQQLLPWLYLKGVSTGNYQEALQALLGEQAQGLSASTISRLKKQWQQEHEDWSQRDLSDKRYIYWWADGIYSNVRMDDRLCLLVIIGVTEQGCKELVAVYDGYRESSQSWYEILVDLRERGLQTAPKLAVGYGALGFWKALTQVYPTCRQQRCWVHKTANVLDKLPKSVQPKVKAALHEIYHAETREAAFKAFNKTLKQFSHKYPGAMKCLEKDKSELLAFYDFPAQHWIHIRTTNPIESAFSTVRLRTQKCKSCGSRQTTLSMVYKLLETAQKHWNRISGFRWLPLVANDSPFKNGELVEDEADGSEEEGAA